MRNWYAIAVASFQLSRDLLRPYGLIEPVLATAPRIVLLAWIIGQSSNQQAFAYAAIGLMMLVMMNWGGIRMGSTLQSDISAGTLDFNVASRTPLTIIMAGRVLAVVVCSVPAGILSSLLALLIMQKSLQLAVFPVFIGSLILGLYSVLSIGFILSPLVLVLRGRAGFFGAITPFIVVLSGFLYPVSLLPPEIQTASWVLPTTWAMNGIIHSLESSSSMGQILIDWAMVFVLSLPYFALGHFLLRVVESRIRITGTLSTNS